MNAITIHSISQPAGIRVSHLLAITALCAGSAFAQPEPESPKTASTLEEVLVSATKRDTSIRDIAGSVGAVGGEQLERMKAQGMEDYLKLVPGVTLAQGGVDDSVPVIRGISTTTTTGGFTALSVGIYLGDMPFQDLFAPFSVPNLHPFDLERVEVLKGPQGTLFGSGALSGAIRYIPRRPMVGEWEAKLQYVTSDTEQGSESTTRAAAVNIPLGDTAALRALTLKHKSGGIYDVHAEDEFGTVVRDEEDADRSDQDSYRYMAQWNIGERLSLSALLFDQETFQNDAFSYADQRERPERSDQPFPSPRESSFGGLNIGATYSFDWFDVLFSGNKLEKATYASTQQGTALGLGNGDDVEAPNTLIGDVDGKTYEIRFSSPMDSDSPWKWLVGVSRLEFNQFIFQFSTIKPRDGKPPPRSPGDVSEEEKVSSQLWAVLDSEATENALFGEVSRMFGERWELTAGLRQYKTELTSNGRLSGAQVVALAGESETNNTFDLTSDGLNPKLSLRFVLNDNVQFYALAAKGFQFGGVQLNPPFDVFVTASEQQGYTFGPYDSSELWNYEIGVRSEWFDKRLRLDLATFYMDWTDLQLTVQVPVTEETLLTPAVGFGLIANVGAAHAQGAELTLDALPWSWLRITSTAAYLEAETDVVFDEDNDAGPVPAGTPLPGAAMWQLSNVIALTAPVPFTETWESVFSVTHTFMDEASDSIRKEETIGGYNTFDARAVLARIGGRIQPAISVAMTNFTDERGVSAYHGSGAVEAFSFIQPRTLTVSLDLQF